MTVTEQLLKMRFIQLYIMMHKFAVNRIQHTPSYTQDRMQIQVCYGRPLEVWYKYRLNKRIHMNLLI